MNRCGIYKMKWSNNNYFYIGKSHNLSMRTSFHLTLLKKGKHQHKVQKVFDEFGHPTFEILEYCKKENLISLEEKYLLLFQNDENILNIQLEKTKSIIYTTIGISVTKEEYVLFKELRNNGIDRRSALIQSLETYKEKYNRQPFWKNTKDKIKKSYDSLFSNDSERQSFEDNFNKRFYP